MCGIVGAIAKREVSEILLEGLKRLEYRGYDSAGMATLETQGLKKHKALGKVAELEAELIKEPLTGNVGIAHTRWATHGKPSVANAHPHTSGNVAVVHNGIIENHNELREKLKAKGYNFLSETDTEVIVHLIHDHLKNEKTLKAAVVATIAELEGAYGLGVVCEDFPDQMITAREGSPLVIGVGIGENFIASDQLALRQVTDRFIYLEEGDVALVSTNEIIIEDATGESVQRPIQKIKEAAESASKGEFRHFMLKEIYEQPQAIKNTLEGRISQTHVLENAFGAEAQTIFSDVQSVQIVACGTSYHSGMVARYWLENIAGVHCQVEIASEFRYRKVVVPEKTLFVTISQSGETADTLAALRAAKQMGYRASLAIVNAPNSSLVRESDLVLMTQAGPEIGVASTKAFTTQLTALFLLTLALGKHHELSDTQEKDYVSKLHGLSERVEKVLTLDKPIKKLSESFAEKHHALFLGRGVEYPVAMEGALKLKEISYIHAEAYPAGELKHGPLALVDADMPVIAVAPNNQLLEKLKSNLEEVRARGGELFVFADQNSAFDNEQGLSVLTVDDVDNDLAPIIYTVPLQLLSYHVAVLKGTDVDQPRNLAKSVTVE